MKPKFSPRVAVSSKSSVNHVISAVLGFLYVNELRNCFKEQTQKHLTLPVNECDLSNIISAIKIAVRLLSVERLSCSHGYIN